MRIFVTMKTRLNLTIEESLLLRMKAYAAKKHLSLSELVEIYFEKITRPAKRKTIIDLVENMKVPEIPSNADLMDEYYKDMENKYGV